MTNHSFISVEVREPSPNLPNSYNAAGLCVYTDCATGELEVVISPLVNGYYSHGFNLLLSIDASFNSNSVNSDAILLTRIDVKKSFMWYREGKSESVIYTLGEHDRLLVEIAIKTYLVKLITENNIKTILRPEVFDVDFMLAIEPELRSYGGHEYLTVDYVDPDSSISLEKGYAAGVMVFEIKGVRRVAIKYKVTYDETNFIAAYLGGKLSEPKVAEIKNLKIETFEPIKWQVGKNNVKEGFELSKVELDVIKKRLISEIKTHYEEEAYPLGKDYHINN